MGYTKKYKRAAHQLLICALLSAPCNLAARGNAAPIRPTQILPTTTLLTQKADLRSFFDAICNLSLLPDAASFEPIRTKLAQRTVLLEITAVQDELQRARALLHTHAPIIGTMLAAELSAFADRLIATCSNEGHDDSKNTSDSKHTGDSKNTIDSTRAPRPGTDTGSSGSTGPIGEQFSGTTACGCGGGGGGTTPTNAYLNPSNSFGANATIGLADNHTLGILTNNVPRVEIAATGATIIKNGNALLLEGATSGYSGFVANATSTINAPWQLPAADGVAGDILSTDGSGVLSWITAPVPLDAYVKTGNAFGADALLGLTDTFNLSIITDNKTRISVDSSGNTTYTSNYKACAYPSGDVTPLTIGQTVLFNTISFDPGSNYVVNPTESHYVAPVTGTYMVTAEVCIKVGDTGTKRIALQDNGASIAGSAAKIFVPTYTSTTAGIDTYIIPLVALVDLTAGHSLSVVYTHGGTADTIIADGTQFGVHLMSVTPT